MWNVNVQAGTDLSVPALIIVIIVSLYVMIMIITIMKKKRKKNHPMDEMEGYEFEYFCAGLLEKHGFTEVEVTKSSGDFGADILARKEDITYAVQCKCYTSAVGVAAVQEVYAGKDYYDRMVGVVMTNHYFTKPAVTIAEKLKILLWDRGYIEAMMEEN